MLRRKVALVLCSILVVLGTVALVWYRQLANNPALVAQSISNGWLDDNPDVVYNYRAPNEESEAGLTQERFRRVWINIVRPVLAEAKLKMVIEPTNLNNPPTEGTCAAIGQLPDGTRHEFQTSTWVTENGPKTAVLEETLREVWMYAWQADASHDRSDNRRFYAARMWGLRRDRAFLEGIGLKGMVGLGDGRFRTWDHYLVEWEKYQRIIEGQTAQ